MDTVTDIASRTANALRWQIFKIMAGVADPAQFPGDEIEKTIKSFVAAALREQKMSQG